MEGWVKIHRKILDHYLFQEDRVFSKYEAWQYIILMVNHKSNKFLLGNELIELKAGQMITSQAKLMKKFKWSKSKLIGFLKIIESDGMIRVDSDTKKTTLTVIKYKDYQHSETEKEPRKDRKETANRLRADTNKNDKNDKEESERKKENSLPPFNPIKEIEKSKQLLQNPKEEFVVESHFQHLKQNYTSTLYETYKKSENFKQILKLSDAEQKNFIQRFDAACLVSGIKMEGKPIYGRLIGFTGSWVSNLKTNSKKGML